MKPTETFSIGVVTERRSGPRRNVLPPAPSIEWAYFFDLDGTLVEIAQKPSGVRLEQDVLRLLRSLFLLSGGAVALVSGRSMLDVDRILQGTELPVAGQHGLERRSGAGVLSRHEFDASELDAIGAELLAEVNRHHGLLLELKGLSVALHYRNAPHHAEFARALLNKLQKRLGDDYVIQPGKMVVELKPAGKDKGVAVSEFMQEKPFGGRIPVFVGDDATDEYGFAIVNELGGHSIKVGGGPTGARWRLRSVTAVRDWLESGIAGYSGNGGSPETTR